MKWTPYILIAVLTAYHLAHLPPDEQSDNDDNDDNKFLDPMLLILMFFSVLAVILASKMDLHDYRVKSDLIIHTWPGNTSLHMNSETK